MWSSFVRALSKHKVRFLLIGTQFEPLSRTYLLSFWRITFFQFRRSARSPFVLSLVLTGGSLTHGMDDLLHLLSLLSTRPLHSRRPRDLGIFIIRLWLPISQGLIIFSKWRKIFIDLTIPILILLKGLWWQRYDISIPHIFIRLLKRRWLVLKDVIRTLFALIVNGVLRIRGYIDSIQTFITDLRAMDYSPQLVVTQLARLSIIIIQSCCDSILYFWFSGLCCSGHCWERIRLFL